MKKLLVISVSTMLMLSSCGTYAGSGAATGGYFGSIVGSAIGGITGGWRGNDIGSLVGLAGGAVVGAAIGAAADNAEQQKYEDYKAQRQERIRNMQRKDAPEPAYDDSGFDSSNSGDDRLFGFDEHFSATEDVNAPATLDIRFTPLEIRHARLLDAQVKVVNVLAGIHHNVANGNIGIRGVNSQRVVFDDGLVIIKRGDREEATFT